MFLPSPRRRSASAVAGVALLAALLPTAAAQADDQAGVPDLPRNDTPYVEDGEVHDGILIGDTVYVGGDFTGVRQDEGEPFVAQAHLFAYDVNSGELVASFDPVLDGAVYELEASEDGQHLFVGGEFASIDGVFSERVAKLTLDGTVVSAFDSDLDARVDGLAVGNGRVYVGGDFTAHGTTQRVGLAALDATSGDLDPGFVMDVTGNLGRNDTFTVRALELSPDGDTLWCLHNARYVAGVERPGVAAIDVSGPTAIVGDWYTSMFAGSSELYGNHLCGATLQLRDLALSPDGSYFVSVGKGNDRPPSCDTSVRFDTAVEPDGDNDPVWITRHHDSVFAVEVSPDAVFVGGHFFSAEAKGFGDPEPWVAGDPNKIYDCARECAYVTLDPEVVRRGQVAALDPADGKAFPWNPETNSFVAVFSLTWTERGLLLGHDRQLVGGFPVGNHAFFDVLDLVLPDDEPPAATTVTPSPQQVFAQGPITLDGTATDDVRAEAVTLAIKDRATDLWLDRSTGSFGPYTNFVATIDPPAGGTAVDWSHELTLPEGSYLLVAIAKDQADKASAPVYTQFGVTSGPVDVNRPVVDAVTSPGPSEQLPTGPVALEGTVSDDVALDEVRLALKRKGDDTWYDAGLDDFVAGFRSFTSTLASPGATSSTFASELALGAGDYALTVNAVDEAGRTSDAVYRSFSVTDGPLDQAPPTASATSPEAGDQVAAGLTTLAGQASDDVGVEVVRLALKNRVDDTWYDRATDAFVVGYRNWDAVLAAPGSTSTGWSSDVTLPDGDFVLTTKAFDAAGRESSPTYHAFTATSGVIDQAAPTAATTTPAGGEQVAAGTVELTGTASDDVALAEVRLALKNRADDTWYDAATQSFLAGYRQFPATLTTPGGTSSTWSAQVQLPAGDFTLSVFARDEAGRQSPTTFRSFAAVAGAPDETPPSVAMTSPEPGAVVPVGPVPVSGNAADDREVATVRMAVKDKATGEWYDAATASFVPGYRSFATSLAQPGATSTTWDTVLELPVGDFTLTMFSEDAAGNRSTFLYRSLSAEDGAPN